jgi:hypothetical protein
MANTIEKVSGDVQTQVVSTAVALPLVVVVKTTAGVPVASQAVTWAITVAPAGSTGEAVSASSVNTDANGLAQVTFTTGTATGTYAITASVAGLTGSPILFYAYAVAKSRVELALAQIISEFQSIDTGSGYRTTPNQVIGSIRHPDEIQTYPEIGIELGDETLETKDTNWTVFDSVVPVVVVGAVKCDTDLTNNSTKLLAETEKLVHDMKRVVATIMRKYIIATNAWNVVPEKNIVFARLAGAGEKRNIAAVYTTFQIRIRNQDSSFDD